MQCPICHKRAVSVIKTTNYHRIKCPGCGEFKLTSTLEMALADHQFDVEASRNRLFLLRANTQVPILTAYDCHLLRPINSGVPRSVKPIPRALGSA